MQARLLAFALCVLSAGAGQSFAQSDENVRYYYTTTPSGEDVPRPDPWCGLQKFGGQSLWACPKNGARQPATAKLVDRQTTPASTRHDRRLRRPPAAAAPPGAVIPAAIPAA